MGTHGERQGGSCGRSAPRHKTPPRGADGFTLIELLIVLVILAILIAIATPMYLGQRDKARVASLKEAHHSLCCSLRSYAIDHGDVLPASPVDLATVLGPGGTDPQMESWPDNPWTGGPVDTTSSSEGNITYVRNADCTTCTLTIHGRGGEVVAL